MMFVDPVACLRSVCDRIDAKSHEINVSDENVIMAKTMRHEISIPM